MKKIVLILAMVFAASAFSSEACFRRCDSAFNQNGLMCHKVMQICMRMGPVGTEGVDMCFEDYQYCIAKGKADHTACYAACENSEEE